MGKDGEVEMSVLLSGNKRRGRKGKIISNGEQEWGNISKSNP